MKTTKINKLVMHGFKSFAKKTELDFSEDFNVILGPNGSGKSNVLDALVFVLGKSGSKGLRAEKTANLIYNGGKKKQPSKQAEVSIYLDNKKKKENNNKRVFSIDEDEVKITRILKKNGSSNYYINDKKVTRQNIIELLRQARINPDGYNIILQGDIISFVEQSGIERRQIIEQITGINVYEERKQKALNELKKVEEKIKEAEILITERETHLKELKKDRDQALKYKNLEENIQSYKATLLHRKNKKELEEEKKLEENKKMLEEKIKEYEEKKQKIIGEIEKVKKEIKSINEEIESKGEKEQVELQKKVEELKITITKKESRITVLEGEIKKIEERKIQLEKELEEIEEKKESIKKTNKLLEEEKNKNKKEITILEEKILNFKKKHKIEDDNLDKKIEEYDKKTEELQSELIKIKEEQQELLRQKDRLEYEYENIKKQQQKIKELSKEHQKEIQEIKNKKELFKKIVKEIEKILLEDSKLASKNSSLRRQLESLEEEKNKINIQINSIKSKVFSSRAIELLLKHKKEFKIHGTVLELIKTSREKTIAVETAAGNRLNSIVIENEDYAKKAIEFLRNNKAGTATFLPLNKIQPNKDRETAIKHKGKTGVLGLVRENITYDKKYEKIMKYVFGDTLIVRNIDVAKKLGFGTARFVTLEGDIIEVSGAMTGGYRQNKSKGINLSSLNEKLLRIEEEYESIKKEYVKNAEKRQKIEEELTKLKVQKSELEGEIIKAEKSLHLTSQDLEADKNKEKELKEKIKVAEEKLKILQKKSTDLTKKITSLKIERQQLKNKINESKNPRVLAELTAFEQKKRELEEKNIILEAEIKNNTTRIKEMYSLEEEKIKKIIKQIEKEQKEFTKELEELKKTLLKEKKELEEKEKKAQKFYEEYKELFKKRNEKTDYLKDLEVKKESLEGKIRENEIKLNNLSLKIAEVKARIASLKEELEEYKNVKILSEEEISIEGLQSKIKSFEKLLSELGNVNLKALDIYEEVKEQYEKLKEKKEQLEKEMKSIKELIEEIEEKKKELFLKTFNVVNEHFKKFFSELSSKGTATLELENPENPFEGGVYIKVNITGKKYLDIRSLSGGEKTMTALAFIFSIQEHDPAPFYILDEVDAALDKKNSEKLGEMIKKYSKRAQYIVISHNDVVISKADTLFGVSMNEDGISKIVSLKI